MKKPPLESKEILNLEEAIKLYDLSNRKMRALLQKDKHLNFLLMYGKRKLIVKSVFEIYLNEHPELKRRNNYGRTQT